MSQPTQTFWQRLANHPVYIGIALVAAVVTLLVFLTGKNLPDLLHHADGATSASAGPNVPPTASALATESLTAGTSDGSASPPADAGTTEPEAPSTDLGGGVNPPSQQTSVAAPAASAIEACIDTLNGGRSHISDYNLTSDELGLPATLTITVAAADDPYTLWVEDSTCTPTPLTTYAPGQSGTFTLYRGAVWDFVRQDGTGGFTGAPGPINPSQPGPFEFEDHNTQITVS